MEMEKVEKEEREARGEIFSLRALEKKDDMFLARWGVSERKARELCGIEFPKGQMENKKRGWKASPPSFFETRKD